MTELSLKYETFTWVGEFTGVLFTAKKAGGPVKGPPSTCFLIGFVKERQQG